MVAAGRLGGIDRYSAAAITVTKISSDGKEILRQKQVSFRNLLAPNKTMCHTVRSMVYQRNVSA